MDIRHLVASYQSAVKEQETELRILKQKIFRTGTFRLGIVLAATVFAFILWNNTAATTAVLSSGALLFLCLLKYHDRLYRRKNYAETKYRYLVDELKGLEYDFSAFDGAEHMTDAGHRFASDLDLFGKGSFFQSVNRTVTSFGTNRLAE
ncbi:MAG: hypothetical protein LBQ70_00940, partial [Prevotellaceae bacterium]|nr:hypothetical protein [Prevotellaceae bacterium]